jgi:hypothetical protein
LKVISDEALELKDKLTAVYHELLIDPHSSTSIKSLFESILALVRGSDDAHQVVPSVWKAAVRTLNKLFAYPGVVHSLLDDTGV